MLKIESNIMLRCCFFQHDRADYKEQIFASKVLPFCFPAYLIRVSHYEF